jgi:meiotic recombination protein SPO11
LLLSFASLRLFLRKLKLTLKIPVLALVDSDPYGLKILSVYMKGEDTLAAHAC